MDNVSPSRRAKEQRSSAPTAVLNATGRSTAPFSGSGSASAGADRIERDVVGRENGAQLPKHRTGRGVRLDLAERHLPDGGDGPLQVPRLSPQLGALPLLQGIGVVAERRSRLLAIGRAT